MNKSYITLALVAVLLFLCAIASFGQTQETFFRAVHQVETGGRLGAIKGDHGKALGPYQIHYAYWVTAKVKGNYSQCAEKTYAEQVMVAYFRRVCPHAWARRDYETLARVHNSGPNWKKKVYITNGYWYRVQKALNENNQTHQRLSSSHR